MKINYDNIRKKADELEHIIKTGEKKDIYDFFENLTLKEKDPAEAYIFFIVSTARIFESMGRIPDKSTVEDFFLNHFREFPVGEIRRELFLLSMGAKKTLSLMHRKNLDIMCDEVLDIINKEYSDETLSLTSISRRLHVSSNYLSTVLKKVKGATFTEFLTQKRMSAAKDLISCTSMKLHEISELCGYSDRNYFSYCFKKYFGISPNIMRQKIK